MRYSKNAFRVKECRLKFRIMEIDGVSSSEEPRSITVEKTIEVEIDPGTLLITDPNEISRLQLK